MVRVPISDAKHGTHEDAQMLVDPLGGPAALDRMYDDFSQLIASRPRTKMIPARVDDEDTTLRRLREVLAAHASDHNGQ